MRVLNVVASIHPVKGGGSGERTVQMSRYLVQSGIECTLLTLDLGLSIERMESLQGVKVVALPCASERFYLPKVSLRSLYILIKSVDIVHLIGHWTFLNALVYVFVRYLHKPYVVCPAGALHIYGRSKIMKRLYNKIIGKKIIQNAAKHIAITEDEMSQFQSYGVENDTITVIPNGINEEDYLIQDDSIFRNKYGIGEHAFLLFVGRLNFIKGPDLLLEAFCRVKDKFKTHHLVFLGTDEGMLSELQQIVLDSNLNERVHFLGYVGGYDKANAYRMADILVIPSRHEAMSIVALEAGIMGTPILFTNQCGLHEMVNVGGGQEAHASVLGLQHGLEAMLSDSKQLKSMGVKLREYTRENFFWGTIVKKYIFLYNDILITTRASK